MSGVVTQSEGGVAVEHVVSQHTRCVRSYEPPLEVGVPPHSDVA